MSNYLKAKWQTLSPTSKRIATISACAAAVLSFSFALDTLEDSANGQTNVEAPIRKTKGTILTDFDAKKSTVDSLSSEMKFMRTEYEKLRKEIARSSATSKDLENKLVKIMEKSNADTNNRLDRLEARISILDDSTQQINRDVESSKTYTDEEIAKLKSEGVKFTINDKGIEVPVAEYIEKQEQKTLDVNGSDKALGALSYLEAKTPEDFFAKAPKPDNRESRPVIDSNTGKAKLDRNGKPIMTENTITITSNFEPKEPEIEVEKQQDFIFIPAGTIITGVFLSGLDAPTGKSAQKDPFPVLIRIQKEAILPNNFQADIRECFLLMSGYGDLSSERVMLRGEKISCLRDDGGVIETNLNSFAVGDDGKSGVRGTLVSKQGQIIARSLLAGFAGGFAEMFDTTSTPTLNTSSDGTVKYEDVYSNKAVKGASAKGVSTALTRISDFYMQLAESMYPVIEIDAGRSVDIIVQNGTKLKVNDINQISNDKLAAPLETR